MGLCWDVNSLQNVHNISYKHLTHFFIGNSIFHLCLELLRKLSIPKILWIFYLDEKYNYEIFPQHWFVIERSMWKKLLFFWYIRLMAGPAMRVKKFSQACQKVRSQVSNSRFDADVRTFGAICQPCWLQQSFYSCLTKNLPINSDERCRRSLFELGNGWG